MQNDWVELGEIVNTHGIKGEVKVNPWTDSPEFFDSIEYILLPGGQRLNILSSRAVKNCALLKFEGIDTVEQAQALKGKTVYIEKTDLPKLPKGAHYIRDIIGMRVVTPEGGEIGTVKNIFQTGANDVYEVQKPDGKLIYLPSIPDCIKKVDVEGGTVTAVILEGLE